MQKLRERNTYTPTDVPQVRSNCGLSLNNPKGLKDSAAGLKTSLNNPDAAPYCEGVRRAELEVSASYTPKF